jgi:hypothetical protein
VQIREAARFVHWCMADERARNITEHEGFAPLHETIVLPRVLARLSEGLSCGQTVPLPRVPAMDNVTAEWKRPAALAALPAASFVFAPVQATRQHA